MIFGKGKIKLNNQDTEMRSSSSDNQKTKALLLGTIIYGIGSFGTKFLSFLIVPLYTYFIMPEELGDYDLLVTTVSLVSPLLTLKISDAAYRWIIKNKENQVPYISATYKLLLRNCLFCALFLSVINFFIPVWNCYYFILILIGDRILECLQKLLRGVKNQKLFAISGIFHTAIMVGLNVVKVCYLKQGVVALLQSSVISLYATILLVLLCEKRLRTVDFKPNYKQQQHEMLRYSAPLVPSTLGWWVMSASDRYVIRWMLGSTANGIYSVAYKFPTILQTIFTMFNSAWTDMALAQLSKGEKSEEYTKQVFQQLFKISFGMVFVLIPFTKIFMKIVLSERYEEAAIYVGFLYLGTVFQGFSSFVSIGYLQGKKTKGAATTSIYGAIVNLCVDLFCMKFIGLFAAGISTFLGFFVMWLTRMRDIKKVFPIKVNCPLFILYLLVGIALAIITIWSSTQIDIILTGIACVFFLIDNRKVVVTIGQKISRKRGAKRR